MDWIQFLRAIIQPLRNDIFARKISFWGSLINKKQDETISPFLLTLTSMLIDGQVDLQQHCSQAALTTAELISFHGITLELADYIDNS